MDAANLENITPLCLAYRSGDLATMKALLTANAEPDDGTLHEAARRLDLKAIELLLEYDHDPNRPSPEHEGRSALAELCYQAPAFAQYSSDKNLERDAKKAMKALIKGGARTNIQTKTADDCEKSLLLLALDSENPLVMAKAFLDSDQWKYVNEDFNLYTDGEYTFSPAMYVEKEIWENTTDQVQAVLNLLKSYQVKRRFWRNEGEQPGDMVNAPPDILAAETARKAIIAEKLRKERERQDALDEAEAEVQAEYERRHKKAALERTLEREKHDAELAEEAKARDLDIKYQESLLEIDAKRREGEVQQQERLAAIQARLKAQTVAEDIRKLAEERINIQERSKEGYIAAELYNRMTQAGIGGSAGYPALGASGRRALGYN